MPLDAHCLAIPRGAVVQFVIGPDATDPRNCRALWMAVLRECVNVILGTAYDASPTARRDMADWVQTDDFDLVCDLAGVDACQMRVGIEDLRGTCCAQAEVH